MYNQALVTHCQQLVQSSITSRVQVRTHFGDKLNKCQARLNELGYGYIVCVYSPQRIVGKLPKGMHLQQYNIHHMYDPD